MDNKAEKLNEKLKIHLNNTDVKYILMQLTENSDDRIAYNKYKNYGAIGLMIIKALFSVYAYINEKDPSLKRFNERIDKSSHFFANKICEIYDIKELLTEESNDENNNNNNNNQSLELVGKLIVFIAKEYGLINTYQFLVPFFINYTIPVDTDNITYVNRCARYIGEEPVFDISRVNDRDGDLYCYVCKVKIGNKYAIAEDYSKIVSKKKACEKIIYKYNLKYDLNRKSQKERYNIDDNRKKELEELLNIFGLSKEYFNYDQIEEILTDSSYNKNALVNNEHISIVGQNVLTMMSNLFYLSNRQKINYLNSFEILKDENLKYVIPDEIIKYISVEEKTSAIKTKIFKCLIGMEFVNCIAKNNYTMSMDIISYVFNLLNMDFKIYVDAYLQGFKKIAALLKFKCSIKCAKYDEADYKGIKCNVVLESKEFKYSNTGFGHTEKEAKNNAIKEVLFELKEKVNNNPKAIELINDTLDLSFKKNDKISDDAKEIKKDFFFNSQALVRKDVDKIVETERAEEKQVVKKDVNFDSLDNILYVSKGTLSCRNRKHNIVETTGIIKIIEGISLRININYCKTCKIYFISYDEYMNYRKKYGDILGNVRLHRHKSDYEFNNSNLAEESILHFSGYNVSKRLNLSVEKRRIILTNLMRYNILPKHRIIEYLHFFINNANTRDNMGRAIQKWTEDLNWLRNYNIEKQQVCNINSIKKW